jgi:hypothetical protein
MCDPNVPHQESTRAEKTRVVTWYGKHLIVLVTNERNIQTCITLSCDVQIGPNKVQWEAIRMNYAIMLLNS